MKQFLIPLSLEIKKWRTNQTIKEKYIQGFKYAIY